MKHALIIGGGIAGLCAAQVASRRFERVTILERDGMGVRHARRGVGQTEHLHVLLAKGRQVLEELFPGLDMELAQSGAQEIDWGSDTAWLSRTGWFPRERSGVLTRSCGRRHLEETLRKRVFSLPGIEVRECVRAVAPVFKRDSFEAVEVEAENGSRSSVLADFFIDASGRAGAFSSRPYCSIGNEEKRIDASVGYASVQMEIPKSVFQGFRQLYVQMRPPRCLRGGVMTPLENGLTMVTLVGAGGESPGSDMREFIAFSRTLADPIFHEALMQARPAGPIATYRRTAMVIQPRTGAASARNFVAIGDARCALNPVYGQGMTLAALSAQALETAFESGSAAFARRVAGFSRIPWTLGAGEDLRVPKVKTAGLGSAERVFLKALPHLTDRVIARAVRNPSAHRKFLRVLHLLEFPGVLR